jgi:hypothetical protein
VVSFRLPTRHLLAFPGVRAGEHSGVVRTMFCVYVAVIAVGLVAALVVGLNG